MFNYTIDLKLAVPLLVNLLLHLFQVPSDDPVLKVTRLSLGFFLLFLVVSIRLPVTLSLVAEPIRLRFGDLFCFSRSGLLAVALLLASFVLSPSIFLYVYPICICIYIYICIAPGSGTLWNMLSRFLQAISTPTLLITCTTTPTQEEEEDEEETTTAPRPHPGLQQPISSASPPPGIEFELNEIVVNGA